jgi:transcriptional regulator with XRE-family HTH domain
MPSASYPFVRNIVRALRVLRGLTQEQFAEKAGLDYKYYQRFERGRTPAPTLTTLERFGRVLRVKPWVLICDEETLVIERTGLPSLERRSVAKPGRPKKKR